MSDIKKTAIVTGGSRGIGRAICTKFAELGMNIAFTYSSREEEAKKTEELCRQLGAEVISARVDIKDPEACSEFVKQVQKEMGSVDVLVNNAGITKDNIILRMSEEDFEDVMRTNSFGSFYMMKAAAKIMLRQRSGSIINMSSVSGLMGNIGQMNYAASKASVIGMTKSLAKELASRGIRVNAIAPGMIQTDMTAAMTDEAKAAMEEMVPLKRIGKPEDVANLAAFLASEDSSYITGQVLSVDGGLYI